MLHKTILLIVASYGYQPLEYGVTRHELEKAGIKVIVASNQEGIARSGTDYEGAPYTTAPVDITIDKVDPSIIDGAFIVGGGGALTYLDNPTTYHLMRTIASQGKPFGAICISPRILAKAGLLEGKKATGWNKDNLLENVFRQHHAQYEKKPVVTDGNIVTADGPLAAQEFGKAIVKVLSTSQLATQ